jgi:hypothetical protein
MLGDGLTDGHYKLKFKKRGTSLEIPFGNKKIKVLVRNVGY